MRRKDEEKLPLPSYSRRKRYKLLSTQNRKLFFEGAEIGPNGMNG